MRTVRIHSRGGPDVPGLRNDARRATFTLPASDGYSRRWFKTTRARTFTLDHIVDAHRYREALQKIVVTA